MATDSELIHAVETIFQSDASDDNIKRGLEFLNTMVPTTIRLTFDGKPLSDWYGSKEPSFEDMTEAMQEAFKRSSDKGLDFSRYGLRLSCGDR